MPAQTQAIVQELAQLDSDQIQQVANFIAFLKFQNRRHHLATLRPEQLASLATEFAEEDRALAETGMGDYADRLQLEDQL